MEATSHNQNRQVTQQPHDLLSSHFSSSINLEELAITNGLIYAPCRTCPFPARSRVPAQQNRRDFASHTPHTHTKHIESKPIHPSSFIERTDYLFLVSTHFDLWMLCHAFALSLKRKSIKYRLLLTPGVGVIQFLSLPS